MKTESMLDAFEKFKHRMAERYDEVHEHLKAGRYEQAYEILTALTVSHAKTTVSLRNVLIKAGHFKEDK